MNESEIINGRAVVVGSFHAPAHFMLTGSVKILLARQLTSSQDHATTFPLIFRNCRLHQVHED